MFFLVLVFYSKPLYTHSCSYLIMPRISLDVTQGTFGRLDKICKEEFREKAGYLRLLINEDFVNREKGEGKKR